MEQSVIDNVNIIRCSQSFSKDKCAMCPLTMWQLSLKVEGIANPCGYDMEKDAGIVIRNLDRHEVKEKEDLIREKCPITGQLFVKNTEEIYYEQ